MKGHSSENEGVRIIAEFTDQVIPLPGAPPLNGAPAGSGSVNEGVRPVAEFTDTAIPLDGSAPEASSQDGTDRPS